MIRAALSLAVILLAAPASAHESCYGATISEVYDGDTVTAGTIELGFGVSLKNERVRLLDINAPEIRPLATRAEATISRSALAARVLGKSVTLCANRPIERDSFGRILATVWLDGVSVNQWMLDHGFARPYGD